MKNSWKRPVPFQLGLVLAVAAITVVTTQDPLRDTGPDERRRERLTRPGRGVEVEGPAGGGNHPTEAPAGFDNQTNGFIQGPDFDTLDEDNVVPLRSFNDNRFIFEEVETIGDGLGPDLQRAELQRVPPERRDRRREPGRRASHGPH